MAGDPGHVPRRAGLLELGLDVGDLILPGRTTPSPRARPGRLDELRERALDRLDAGHRLPRVAAADAARARPALLVNEFETQLTFVAEGLGVAFIPRLARSALPPGVVARRSPRRRPGGSASSWRAAAAPPARDRGDRALPFARPGHYTGPGRSARMGARRNCPFSRLIHVCRCSGATLPGTVPRGVHSLYSVLRDFISAFYIDCLWPSSRSRTATGAGILATLLLVLIFGNQIFTEWADRHADARPLWGFFLAMLAWPRWWIVPRDGSGNAARELLANDLAALLLILFTRWCSPVSGPSVAAGGGAFILGWAALIFGAALAAFTTDVHHRRPDPAGRLRLRRVRGRVRPVRRLDRRHRRHRRQGGD